MVYGQLLLRHFVQNIITYGGILEVFEKQTSTSLLFDWTTLFLFDMPNSCQSRQSSSALVELKRFKDMLGTLRFLESTDHVFERRQLHYNKEENVRPMFFYRSSSNII